MFEIGSSLWAGVTFSAGLTITDRLRPRNCDLKDSVFVFSHGFLRLTAERLPPALFKESSGVIPLSVFNRGTLIDQGCLEIDRVAEKITPHDFKKCFRFVLGEPIGAVVGAHVFPNDRLTFLADNDMFKLRAPVLARKSGSGIRYLAPQYRH